MTLTLHHCHQARSMRSLWLLHELEIDFSLVMHEFGPALRDPDFLAISPLGRVPALVDGDLALFESGAICEYLCEEYGKGDLWRAPGTPDRAAWLQWLHFAETIGQHLAALTQQHIVIREDRDRSPTVMKLESLRLAKALGVIEAALRPDGYLLSGGFSAVDIGIGYDIYIARHFVELGEYPRISAYLERVSARPAFRASLPPPDANLIYSRPFYAVWSQSPDLAFPAT